MPSHLTVTDVTNLPVTKEAQARIVQLGIGAVSTIGDARLLQLPLLGFLCSTRCPGRIVLETYDAAKALRGASITIAGGFHSPMEQECRRILLRGTQPVVWCPARSIEKFRLSAEHRDMTQSGRMLIASPFTAGNERMTAKLAECRNQFLAMLAKALFVPYASTGGMLHRICIELLAQQRTIWTLDCTENRELISQGARPVLPGEIKAIPGAL